MEAASGANNRQTVVKDFFAIKNRSSPLGTYSIDKNGDTNLGPLVFSADPRQPGPFASPGSTLAPREDGVTRARTLALLCAVAGLAGCGSAKEPSGKVRGTTLTIYYSGPSQGASSVGSRAALNGAMMALDAVRGRVGKYRIRLRPLDDSTRQRGGWDPGQTTQTPGSPSQDPTTIGYLGDFNSGASSDLDPAPESRIDRPDQPRERAPSG